MDRRSAYGLALLTWTIFHAVLPIAAGEGSGNVGRGGTAHAGVANDSNVGLNPHKFSLRRSAPNWRAYNYTRGKDVVAECDDVINESNSVVHEHVSSLQYDDSVWGVWSVRGEGGGIKDNLLTGEKGRAYVRVLNRTDEGNGFKQGISNYSMSIFLTAKQSFNLVNLTYADQARKHILAEGVYSNESGKFCMVACAGNWMTSYPHQAAKAGPVRQPRGVSNYMSSDVAYILSVDPTADCSIKISLDLQPGDWKHGTCRIHGSISSLHPSDHESFFDPIELNLKVTTGKEQKYLHFIAAWTESILLAVEIFCILFQLFYMHVRPDRAPWVSIFMVVLNVVVGVYRMAQSLYGSALPWRDFLAGSWPSCSSPGSRCYAFLLPSAVSASLALAVVSFHGVLLILLTQARRKLTTTAAKKQPRPIEKPVIFLCVPFYVVGALVSGLVNQFDTFLILVKLYFLVPQVVANALWDTKEKALHPIYTGGVTITLATAMLFTFYRDQIIYMSESVPSVWLVGNPVAMVIILFLLHSQQSSCLGGRWFLPRGWLREREGPSEEEIGLVENPAHDKSDHTVV